MSDVRSAQHACSLTPLEYWSMRDDYKYHAYLSQTADPPVNHEILSQTEEDGYVTRETTVTPVTNPIPYSLRGMLGCRNGFTFKIKESWWRDQFDADHPMMFTTEPPVMKDRISVTGKQWVESDGGTGSILFFELSVDCRVKGVGSMVSRGIVDGSLQSYTQIPRLCLEYRALKQASADANEAFDRASRLSHMVDGGDDDDGDDGETGGLASRVASSPALGRAASAREIIEDGRRLRARLRWRMALMGVRFRRNVQLQTESEDFRLAVVRVDEPRSDGYGPSRHTTYRITTRIKKLPPGEGASRIEAVAAAAASDEGIVFVARKRFSDFPPLCAALRAFLPGVHLPALPDKKLKNRHAPEVIEARRATLETFLQSVLDHPILATADELAAFFAWQPADVRAPLFARAQTCLHTPASRQRLAMARVYALRKRNSSTGVRDSMGGDDPRDDTSRAPPASPALSHAGSEMDATLSREASSMAASPSTYHSAVQSPALSRFDSGLSVTSEHRTTYHTHHHPRASLDDDFDHDGAVRKHASFSDALAAAIVRAAEEASDAAADAPRCHVNSRASSTTSATASTGFADAAERAAAQVAARIEVAEAAERAAGRHAQLPGSMPGAAAAASSGGHAGPSSDEASVAARVLIKLEDIDGRLRAIEAQRRSGWIWGQVMCCAGPPH